MNTTNSYPGSNETRKRDNLNARILKDTIPAAYSWYPMKDITPNIKGVDNEIKARIENTPFERSAALKNALKRSEPKLWKIYEAVAYGCLIIALLSIVAYSILTKTGY